MLIDGSVDIPIFARLTDYVGIWAIFEDALSTLRAFAETPLLHAHLAAAPVPAKQITQQIPAGGNKSIAVVSLTGLLMKSQASVGGTSTIQARRDIRAAAADPNISGILLAIDSPGGTVAGTDDLSADIKAARRMKPVYAHVDDLGASAAYWAASQADKITANSPTALVGSIGTLQVVQDISAAAEKAGIKTLVFGTGSLKGMGTPGAPVTDEQQAHIRSLVNAVQQSFDAAVMKGRGLTATALAAVKHGGVLTATDAMQAKLIDGIQPMGKTIEQLASAAKDYGAGMDRRRAEFETGTGNGLGSLPLIAKHTLPMKTEQSK